MKKKKTVQAIIEASDMPHNKIALRMSVSLDTVRSWASGRRHPCCTYMERKLRSILERP